MPRRHDLETILVIGSGPIVIGQACEFDYSGTQACRVLRAEGYRVVLANSNPATIMTDPGLADRTYVEPLDVDVLTAIVERERPDALLPTLGGQTGLNLAIGLAERGVLEANGVELIGASAEAIAAPCSVGTRMVFMRAPHMARQSRQQLFPLEGPLTGVLMLGSFCRAGLVRTSSRIRAIAGINRAVNRPILIVW